MQFATTRLSQKALATTVLTFLLSTGNVQADVASLGLSPLVTPLHTTPTTFVRGDVNLDGVVNVVDSVATIAYVYDIADEPSCPDAGDINDDGVLDARDAVFSLTTVILDTSLVGSVSGDCSTDSTVDGLGCTATTPCSDKNATNGGIDDTIGIGGLVFSGGLVNVNPPPFVLDDTKKGPDFNEEDPSANTDYDKNVAPERSTFVDDHEGERTLITGAYGTTGDPEIWRKSKCREITIVQNPNWTPSATLFKDIDGDGNVDLIVVGVKGVKYIGTVDRDCDCIPEIVVGDAGLHPGASKGLDLDADKKAEVFVLGLLECTVEESNNLDSHCGIELVVSCKAFGAGASLKMDLDKDGRFDLIVAGVRDLEYSLGTPMDDDGDGQAEVVVEDPLAPLGTDRSVDLDSDGRIDVVVRGTGP
jgi:hypothetical protein